VRTGGRLVSGQEGPVEQGQPPVTHMDLDRALAVLTVGALFSDEQTAAAVALQSLVDRARQYVAGPTSGRLAALCQVLQEPVPDRPEPVNAETVVQAYLTSRDLRVVPADVADRLGYRIVPS